MIAIIPARVGSKGIPQKNFRLLAGEAPWSRATNIALNLGLRTIVTSDAPAADEYRNFRWLFAEAPLHTDECAMIDVVKDVLERFPGPPDEIIVLLQPTQPLRKKAHVEQAIRMLEQNSNLHAVFSVIPVPAHFHADVQIVDCRSFPGFPARRQDLVRSNVRDGTVYAFRRSTVIDHGTIYGQFAQMFEVQAEDTCPLDTPADWAEAERRLKERDAKA